MSAEVNNFIVKAILFGFAPLTIDFIDESYGNIISWEWDFENDGFIDSYLQNPTWEYTEHGVYSVALKIFDGQIETT
jgi:PKD repeat protein